MYYVLDRYELADGFDTVEKARQNIMEDFSEGYRREKFIVEIVNAFKPVPLNVEVVELTGEQITQALAKNTPIALN